MHEEGMKCIASSERVKIYCPEKGRFSFFNSPYPAHHAFSGIDVYPGRMFGDVAPSPVRGKVTAVRRVKCPSRKDFECSPYDYVLLLCSSENPERWIKVLHVEPSVKVGDIVEIGEDIGTLLRSGFFDFWTDPHLHIEVRKPSDPIRARGGFKFERSLKMNESTFTEDLSGTVVESKPEYFLVALNEKLEYGIMADIEGQPGLLDAGIPHYGWIGVHMNSSPKIGGTVRLCGTEIGTIKFAYSDMGVAECSSLNFKLNGKPVGLSLYFYLFSIPLVKIIPHRPNELNLKVSEEVSVVIS